VQNIQRPSQNKQTLQEEKHIRDQNNMTIRLLLPEKGKGGNKRIQKTAVRKEDITKLMVAIKDTMTSLKNPLQRTNQRNARKTEHPQPDSEKLTSGTTKTETLAYKRSIEIPSNLNFMTGT